ncbi:hypothetical protein [Mesorhizobium sp. LNJC405B00]|uniref:hypothetical protein n=1 Tax=Mesorhizobium sp. LNJC405B00 TaxID=1287281 RepID=UPI0003CDE1DD|nr:hypothetical protein [Mesorhizobium sp. LNJC405B00]ESX95980.1 hypothetical protein X755_20400 [Mesorhizobium sp. LNJC405B00]
MARHLPNAFTDDLAAISGLADQAYVYMMGVSKKREVEAAAQALLAAAGAGKVSNLGQKLRPLRRQLRSGEQMAGSRGQLIRP